MAIRMSRITPVVPTNDINASRDFYCSLGFEIVHEHEDYIILVRDDVGLHLTWSEGWHIDPRTNNTQCRICVSEIETLYAHCQELNIVHPNGPLELKTYGCREFTVLDPDNAAIFFYETTD